MAATGTGIAAEGPDIDNEEAAANAGATATRESNAFAVSKDISVTDVPAPCCCPAALRFLLLPLPAIDALLPAIAEAVVGGE